MLSLSLFSSFQILCAVSAVSDGKVDRSLLIEQEEMSSGVLSSDRPPFRKRRMTKGGKKRKGGKKVKRDIDITVMTYNLYIGVDLNNLPTNTFCDSPDPNVNQLCIPKSLDDSIKIIAHDLVDRMNKIADIVKSEDPDVIGLQEVYLIRKQFPGNYFTNPATDATEILLDFLDVMMLALSSKGLNYSVANVQESVDLEYPALEGFDSATGLPIFYDSRMTDRDVLLVKTGIETRNTSGGTFEASYIDPNTGGPVLRGWTALEAKFGYANWYHIINTHLEVYAPSKDVQNAQARELLLAIDSKKDLPVILVGDFNSEDMKEDAYETITDAGYEDVWADQTDFGWTCCHNDTLKGPDSYSLRIDYILSSVGNFDVKHVATLGTKDEDKTASGLWNSDHAGVVATFYPHQHKSKIEKAKNKKFKKSKSKGRVSVQQRHVFVID